MKKIFLSAGALLLGICLMSACSSNNNVTETDSQEQSLDIVSAIFQKLTSTFGSGDSSDSEDALVSTDSSALAETKQAYDVDTFNFIEAGEEYKAVINQSVSPNPFDPDLFVRDGNKMTYEDDTYTSRMGVDISYYQGDIDWEKVKAAGYDFAFIQAGYRGYQAGSLNLDSNFVTNMKGAQDAGLDVGVYFFSQAVNDEEAVEEADYVIKALEDNNLTPTLPIVFDPEKVLSSDSRSVSTGEDQLTSNCVAFCNRITEKGYEPCVYINMLWEAYTIDLSQLKSIPIWYADYVDKPQTPYNFKWWQFSSTSKVDGIPIQCDIDIELYRK